MNKDNYTIEGYYLSSYYNHCTVVPGVLPLLIKGKKELGLFYIESDSRIPNIFNELTKLFACDDMRKGPLLIRLTFNMPPDTYMIQNRDRGKIYEIKNGDEYSFSITKDSRDAKFN